MFNKINRSNSTKENTVWNVVSKVVLFCLVCLATVVVIVAIKSTFSNNSVEQDENSNIANENISEDLFLKSNLKSEIKTGIVQAGENENRQIKTWEHEMDLATNYHMTILEEETYGNDVKIVKTPIKYEQFGNPETKSFGRTQKRKIEVYSIDDYSDGHWYLIEITEIDFFHYSKYSVVPGMYAFKADGSGPLKTINGDVYGEEKEELLNNLNAYLLRNYCKSEKIAGRLGDLETKYSSLGGELVSVILENDQGEVEVLGDSNHINTIYATYSDEDLGEGYKISVEVQYGKQNLDFDKIRITHPNPYQDLQTMNNIRFWDGDSKQIASLTDVKEANKVWNKIDIPEEYLIRTSLKRNVTVCTNEEKEAINQIVVVVEKQQKRNKLYTRVEVKYTRQQFANTYLAAGVYFFDDQYIYTDIGNLKKEDSPRLFQTLVNLAENKYPNVKWNINVCKNMYLEFFEFKNGYYKIGLLGKDPSDDSRIPGYARIKIDRENRVTSFQVSSFDKNINYDGSNIEFYADFSFDLDKEKFYIPQIQ